MSHVATPHIAIVCAEPAGPDDSIFHYSTRLAEAINLHLPGAAEVILAPPSANPAAWTRTLRRLQHPHQIWQYNPYAYGRWGVAPWLAAILRRQRNRSQVVVTIHEAFDDVPQTAKLQLLSRIHRDQIRRLTRASDVAISTSRARTVQIQRYASIPTIEIPVGSAIGETPDTSAVTQIRQRLDPRGDRFVVATFGKDHPVHARGHLAEALDAIATVRSGLLVLNLGSSAPAVSLLHESWRPGFLEGADLLNHLAAADFVLLPYLNGAATNRSTLMAALACGRPVLTTRSETTDPTLLSGAVCATEVSDIDAFGAASANLARDPPGMAALGAAGHAVYLRQFSWSQIGQQTVGMALRGAAPPKVECHDVI